MTMYRIITRLFFVSIALSTPLSATQSSGMLPVDA